MRRDSLCIVQDDAQDWEREAAKMAPILEAAYLTIAATAANNGSVRTFSNYFSSLLKTLRAEKTTSSLSVVSDR
jgi:hypothetical protein